MLLNPTKLGTKDHWDQVYAKEKQNFDEFGDEGEIWFGQDAVDKMVQWALKYCPPDASRGELSILDNGTGNGVLPVCLVEEGYNPSSIAGIDYSQAAIELAEHVAQGRGVEGITFRTVNFVSEEVGSLEDLCGETASERKNAGTWNLFLDKGTFDAMALTAPSDGLHPTEVYPRRVEESLAPGGYFLITSCNFTEDEIKSHFTSRATSLKYHSRIQHPSFTFGGKSGTTYCTVAFQKGAPVNA